MYSLSSRSIAFRKKEPLCIRINFSKLSCLHTCAAVKTAFLLLYNITAPEPIEINSGSAHSPVTSSHAPNLAHVSIFRTDFLTL